MTQADYVALCKNDDKEGIISFNKKLIEEYPFLLPRNRFSDKTLEDFDFSYSEMDSMPHGWRIAFGDDLLRELKAELVKFNYLDEYRIVQIKEKYGGLRWYDNGCPKSASDVIWKYEELSYEYCMSCGSKNIVAEAGWVGVGPLCQNCLDEMNERIRIFNKRVWNDEKE